MGAQNLNYPYSLIYAMEVVLPIEITIPSLWAIAESQIPY